MPCTVIEFHGGRAIVCSRGSKSTALCSNCKRPAGLLCDYPLRGPKAGKTCDRKLCERCAVETGAERHLCPAHARAEAKEGANLELSFAGHAEGGSDV